MLEGGGEQLARLMMVSQPEGQFVLKVRFFVPLVLELLRAARSPAIFLLEIQEQIEQSAVRSRPLNCCAVSV